MNDEKWIDTKLKIKDKFQDVKETIGEMTGEDDTGQKIPEKVEILEFDSPLGRLRMQRTTRPKVLDKKTHYHKGGGGAQVEYVLSEDETSHKLDILKLDEVTGDWHPLDLPADTFPI